MSLDDEVDDEVEQDEVEFDDSLFRATSHTETDQRLLDSTQEAKECISRLIVDEFISEAFVTATNLRNLLGDADGMAADMAETIRSNLIVVAQAIVKDPVAYVVAVSKAKPLEEQPQMLQDFVAKVQEYMKTVGP